VDSILWSSNLIITLFTGVMQYTEKSYLVDMVWDLYIVDDFKGLFKAILTILQQTEVAILDLRFDEILSFFSDYTKSEVFTNV
jgi:hypothetical protein